MREIEAKWGIGRWGRSRWGIIFGTFGQPPKKKREPPPAAPTPPIPRSILQTFKELLDLTCEQSHI